MDDMGRRILEGFGYLGDFGSGATVPICWRLRNYVLLLTAYAYSNGMNRTAFKVVGRVWTKLRVTLHDELRPINVRFDRYISEGFILIS